MIQFTNKELICLELFSRFSKEHSYLEPALGGSLFLKLLGIDIGREAGDLDIFIIEDDIIDLSDIQEAWPGFYWLSGGGSECTRVALHNDKLDIKVDIIAANSVRKKMIKGYLCGSLSQLIRMKEYYINFENNMAGAGNQKKIDKHTNDLIIINKWIDDHGYRERIIEQISSY